MKKLIILYIIAFLPILLFAQKDTKASDILKKTEHLIQKSGGIRTVFEAREKGELWMRGDKFYLNCAGIQTWYNGKTQWSYVETNEEVNISTPTPEELQQINPYLLMKSYKSGYNYQYKGIHTINNQTGYEIVLTPLNQQDITSITLLISTEYIPLYLKIEQNYQSSVEFNITAFQPSPDLSDESFTFDKNKYPDAEIIDLR